MNERYSGFGGVLWREIQDLHRKVGSAVLSKVQFSAESRLYGRGSGAGGGDAQEIVLGAGLTMTGTTLSSSAAAGTRQLTFTFDGGGSVLTTGAKKVYVTVPVACTIVKNRVLADVSGSIVFDIWKDTYTNFPPAVADTITASAKPTLSSAIKSEDSTLTGWTTAIAAGSVLEVNIDSVSTITKAILTLEVTVP